MTATAEPSTKANPEDVDCRCILPADLFLYMRAQVFCPERERSPCSANKHAYN